MSPLTSLVNECRALALRGAWSEVRARIEAAHGQTVGSAQSIELSSLYAEALLRLGRAAQAKATLRETLSQTPPYEGNGSVRRALNLCGAAHFELGELDDAAAAFERVLDLGADEPDVYSARATNNLALIANIRGDYDAALACYRGAIPTYQRLGNLRGLAESYHNMAITHRDQERLEMADEDEQRAIEFARQAQDDRLVAIATVGRAELAMRKGDAAFAEATALRGAEQFDQMSDQARRADALRLAGVARSARGRVQDALTLIDEAVADAKLAGATLIEAECLRARAEVLLLLNRQSDAEADAREALSLFARLGATKPHDELGRWLQGARTT